MSDSKQALIDTLNEHAPAIIRSLNGKIIDVDTEAGLCIMEWEIGENLCHSGNVVQGDVLISDTRNALLVAEHRCLATVGL